MKRKIFHYTTEEVAPYIDWSYFLHAWGMGNATADKLAVQELLHDAKGMLESHSKEQCSKAVFVLCNATGKDDDIYIERERLPLLRQQHSIEGKPNLCLSDFVSPKGDQIGLFATTVVDTFCSRCTEDGYRSIMARTLADRLAEATATLMHHAVRTGKNLWGYAPDEQLTVEQLNREEYQGIRPAVGYPSLPDQSIIFILDRILGLKDIGITLTPNGAMYPHASVCGMMLAHPLSRYFGIGEISEEQLNDYSARRELPAEEIKRFLVRNIQER